MLPQEKWLLLTEVMWIAADRETLYTLRQQPASPPEQESAAVRPVAFMTSLFRAFRSRNYRLFFAGQFTSLAGTWMTSMAMGWLVYRLTGDELMLGLVGFAMQVPTFILAPLSGALVDRWNARTVMICSQASDMLTILTLALITIGGDIQVWHLLAGCSVLGIAKAFDMPARQSLVVQIIERREDLPNAIALNSSMFHGARLIGPVLGGMVIGLAATPPIEAWLGPGRGEGLCFLVDGISYIAVIASLLGLRLTNRPPPGPRRHLLHEVKEGFGYVVGFVPMRAMMLLIAAVALLGIPYGTLLPAIARHTLNGHERTYSILMSAGGCGAFMGALYLARRHSVLGLGRVIVITTCLFGMALVLFSLSTTLWLSIVLLVAAGATSMVTMAGSNTIVQTLVPDTLRGRVMSFYGMTFMGSMPLGALMAGKLATILGAPLTIALGGIACTAAGIIFGLYLPTLRAIARPAFVERGILPA